MRSHRSKRAVLALAVVSLVAASCAGQEKKASNGALLSTDDYLNSACPEAAEKHYGQYVTYWSMWQPSDPEGKVIKHAIDCFSAKTGVTVDVQWLGPKALHDILPSALASGQVPDLVDQDVNMMNAELASRGGVRDMQDVLSTKIGEGRETVADVLPAHTYQLPQNTDDRGRPFVIPYEIRGDAWWYERGTGNGVGQPKTVDEMFNLFDRAKQPRAAAISQDSAPNSPRARIFTQLAERFVGAGGVARAAQDRSGRSWADYPAFLNAAKIVERLAKGGYLPDGWDNQKQPPAEQQLADGTAEYTFGSSSLPSRSKPSVPRQGQEKPPDYGSFQLPMPEGATHNVVEQMPLGFAMLADAKNPEAAQAFVAYMMNKEILNGIPSATGNLPPRSDLPVPNYLADIKRAMDDPGSEHTLVMDGTEGTFLEQILFPACDSLFKGQISAEDFIGELRAQSAEYWKHAK